MTSYKLWIAVAVVVLVVAGGWFVSKSNFGDDLANISTAADAKLTDAQVKELVARISQFMVVPTDETPSAVIIRDVATLAQQQSFYRDAKDGDFLVLYSSRAIIYDAQAGKLVNVGPVVRNETSPSPSVSSSPEATPSGTPLPPEKVTIDVRNGTTTAGLAGATASKIKALNTKENTWATVRTRDAKGSYTTTVLVDLSGGKKPGAVAALEKLLGVTATTTAPTGEATTTADILVIVGK